MNYRFTTPGTLLACFDLDGTLLRPKNGRVFPINADDAELVFPNIPDKLNDLRSAGYKIVIFSNQKKKTAAELSAITNDIHTKVDRLLDSGSNSIDIFIAGSDDYFRKPSMGM
jgi:bifunctional polynucleotide phosphatase/kinase